ncbi:SDR family NAD(P)-dependent oxidoreductase [Sphingomicrobium lutaoense]|uniref:NAD(P)-dependent dehydrogenase (Short-subunit alcohol dehydrogenase family) n=1 Tax=Sphingomicrobium lutaoense TaxID=515949 RepID=A0A839YY93_9SPHN|nr:SDR family NAD(P)-dependent oxidoreductase [Sphingomicrobium lutaoense]MBB3763288.1 NAD(P)-dependent dehydrogenase (short-subunit alcohol dehydrogenase family) [Sphingomicrobium lutaoense]
MTTDRPFEGKLALVTGASRGIGAATAEALAARGAHVVMVARTAGEMESVEERIHAAGGSATLAPLDLLADGAIGKLAHAISQRWEALDIMVLNAATLGSLGPVEHIDGKEFARLISLNLLANQALIAAFDPMMRRSERAELVGLTSSVGAEPRAFWGAYGASKAALDTLLGAYADEHANAGKIRVHIVDPGATRTKMRARAFPGENPDTLKGPETVADAICERIQSDCPTGERMRVEG